MNRHTESFARALRAALREDPDVIVIGELRDLETISLALTAAETGHLVLATLHTDNTLRTLNRVVGAFPRSSRSRCARCSRSRCARWSRSGCSRADGQGRVPALETLIVTKAVANLIRENKVFQIQSILQTGATHGMGLLDTVDPRARAGGHGRARGGAASRARIRSSSPPEGRRWLDSTAGWRLKKQGGSDLHLAAGIAPRLRLPGSSPTRRAEVPRDAARRDARARRRRAVAGVRDERDLDFAYGLPGVARFRANYCRRRTAPPRSSAWCRRRSSRSQQLGLPPAIGSLAQL